MSRLEEITNQRLQGWEKLCNERKSTPMVMIILNPVSAKFEVITTEQMENSNLKLILNTIANSIPE